MDKRGHDPMTFKRNLHSLGYSRSLAARLPSYFLGNQGGNDSIFFPKETP
jgi:hypothetical protein